MISSAICFIEFGVPTVFKKRTLFIVGAGASYEFKLPLGSGLATTIARMTDFSGSMDDKAHSGDPFIKHAFARHETDKVNEYIRAGHQIRDGVQFSHSIDDFLDIHASDPFVNRAGKMAIVRAVLEAEASSTLLFDQSNINNRIAPKKTPAPRAHPLPHSYPALL